MVAGIFTVLIGLAAFGTDLGWLYLNGVRAQRTADAAALAGVIHMPAFFAEADTIAKDIAARNGYSDGVDSTTVLPAPVPGQPRQLEVTVTREVETYLLKVIGIETVTVSRAAVAEYVLPLPLGSPDNQLGGPKPGEPTLWAAIQARYTAKQQGDPFATQCYESTSSSSCNSGNSEYRPGNGTWTRGYYVGIEMPPGATGSQFQVQLYDAGFYDRNNLRLETGDGDWYGDGFRTRYTLWDIDTTPLDYTDNNVQLCRVRVDNEDTTPSSYKNTWRTLCTRNAAAGSVVYPLQIQSDQGHAFNSYGVRACIPNCASPVGAQPRVYGLGDLSLYVNGTATQPELYFAKVEDVNAGKTLTMRLFDPGEASGSNNPIEIRGPNGSKWTTTNCTWNVFPDTGGSTTLPGGNCQRNMTPSGTNYNGDWLTIDIPIPNTYACNPDADPENSLAPIAANPNADCWWTIKYLYSNAVNDRTTWRASIAGEPIHLVLGG